MDAQTMIELYEYFNEKENENVIKKIEDLEFSIEILKQELLQKLSDRDKYGKEPVNEYEI